MAAFHHAVELGPRDGSTFERLQARVGSGATYTVVPTLVLAKLGIAPEWTEVFEMADGSRQEFPVAEARLRIDGRERTTVCVFGKPEYGAILGSQTLESFGLAADLEQGRLAPGRLFLA